MSQSHRTVLGIDASTQSLSAVLLSHSGEILWSHSLAYREDPRLAGLGFEHDTLIIPPREAGEAEQPPRLFVAALDALFADLKAAGVDASAIAAINTSGQQHGHVYLNARAKADFARLREASSASETLLDRLAHARNRQQVQRLLNGLPILGRHQHGAAAFSGNQNGLVRFGRLVDEAVQICACFTGGNGRGHAVLLWCQHRTPKRTPRL